MHQKSYSALFRDGDKNLFGLSTHAWGVIFLLSGSVFDAVDSVMLDVAGDEGVASNALVLYIAIGSFGGAILVDFVFYKFIGYNSKVGNGTVYVSKNTKYIHTIFFFPMLFVFAFFIHTNNNNMIVLLFFPVLQTFFFLLPYFYFCFYLFLFLFFF